MRSERKTKRCGTVKFEDKVLNIGDRIVYSLVSRKYEFARFIPQDDYLGTRSSKSLSKDKLKEYTALEKNQYLNMYPLIEEQIYKLIDEEIAALKAKIQL